VQIVREQFGIMHAEGASGVFIVTSGAFTEEAEQFAAGKNIILIDGIKLKKIIQNAQELKETKDEPKIEITSPSCPVCGSPMIRRKAKRGTWAGKVFLGCSRFPNC
jgi:restriction system protein